MTLKMVPVTLPNMHHGKWRIEKVIQGDSHPTNILMNRVVPEGEVFTRLFLNGLGIMSDNSVEQSDHVAPIQAATGRCLLQGLGLGFILKNILLKDDVTEVIVVEISQSLIDLVSPFYTDPRITYICADAMRYRHPGWMSFDMVWHDIWSTIRRDNLIDMDILYERYKGISAWQGFWCRDECMLME